MGKFSAIAFWTMGAVESGWAEAADKALQPLKGWAEIEVRNSHRGGQEQLHIRMPESQATMVVTPGRGRGTVPADNPRAIEMVVILMALRRVIPSLSLADDNGNDIPYRLSQG